MAQKKEPSACRETMREGLNELGKLVHKYSTARQAAKEFQLAMMTDKGTGLTARQQKHISDLETCGSWLWFRDYYTVGKVKLVKSYFCHHNLICQFCAIRRATLNTSKAMQRYDAVIADQPELVPYMLTLTVKDGPDLWERVTHLKKSWSAMMRRKRDSKRGKGLSVLQDVAGGIKSIEVKRGSRSGLWHPHMHQIVMAPLGTLPDMSTMTARNKRTTALAIEWGKITGDSFIVDCRPLKSGPEGDLIKSLCEVFKYALKFSDLTIDDRKEAWTCLMGRRLCDTWGCFRGLKLDKAGPDDVSEFDGLPYMEQIYRWMDSGGYSVSKVTAVSASGDKEIRFKDAVWRNGEQY